ncbi:MAG: cyclic nucleotide-binding domain-containing protein, partial [Nitrospirae bacterium]|nr:cyclic nucleotide-binding domain-containing protein [Nitrospirota bacterium]
MTRSLHIRQNPTRGAGGSYRAPAPSLLAGFPPFASLPREAQEDLEAALVPVRYGPGSVIIREGEPGDSFFLIRSGRVEVTGKGREGEDLVFARLEAGEGFGEVALLTHAPRTATVRSVGEVELARLDRETFERVLAGHAEVGLLFQERVQTIGLATFLKKATPFAKLPDRALRAVMARMRREEHPAG